ncbi:hypothetical protein ACFLRZ_01195 [Bacteroidota bacterium]
MNRFADLHCHPHMRSFNWLRHKKNDRKKIDFHPWHVVLSKLKAKKKGKRASAYSQCDLIKLHHGNVRLSFVSLYPLEKGWVTGIDDISDKNYIKAMKSLIKNKFFRGLLMLPKNFLTDLIIRIGRDKGTIPAIRDFFESLYMKIPVKRINFLQSKYYDYFSELIKEREFITSRNNQETVSLIYFSAFRRFFTSKKKKKKMFDENPREFKATGTYEIATDGKHLRKIIDESNKLAFVFTIEGANVFNTIKENDYDKIIEKIDVIKNWNTPVFFISFAHHFNNGLCGHAHSIPEMGKLFLSQSIKMNEGFSTLGKQILKYLLSLDNDLNKNEEKYKRRILIDVKHMSAQSRKYYYREIIDKCREKGDHIPIIASHMAYSGIKDLQSLIEQAAFEDDQNAAFSPSKPFNIWNINLSDEDVIEIFKSGGIIGVNFDQRVLGVPPKEKDKSYSQDEWMPFFWRNLKGMMRVILNSDLNIPYDKSKLVNLFGLGTDFDGYIDPMDEYPTVLEFDKFKQDLVRIIKADDENEDFLFGLSPEKFADKVCFENAYDFAVTNFV